MLTSWTGSIPTRHSKQAWEAPEHLLTGATGFLALEPQTSCPQCSARLHPLAPPLVAQAGGDAFATYVNHATYCLDCPTVVVDAQRLKVTLGQEDRVGMPHARLIGVLVSGVSDRGNDSTIYPFDEVRTLTSSKY